VTIGRVQRRALTRGILTRRAIHDSAYIRPKASTLCSPDGHTTLLCERSQYPATFERNFAIILREGIASKVRRETRARVEARTDRGLRMLEVVL